MQMIRLQHLQVKIVFCGKNTSKTETNKKYGFCIERRKYRYNEDNYYINIYAFKFKRATE